MVRISARSRRRERQEPLEEVGVPVPEEELPGKVGILVLGEGKLVFLTVPGVVDTPSGDVVEVVLSTLVERIVITTVGKVTLLGALVVGVTVVPGAVVIGTTLGVIFAVVGVGLSLVGFTNGTGAARVGFTNGTGAARIGLADGSG